MEAFRLVAGESLVTPGVVLSEDGERKAREKVHMHLIGG